MGRAVLKGVQEHPAPGEVAESGSKGNSSTLTWAPILQHTNGSCSVTYAVLILRLQPHRLYVLGKLHTFSLLRWQWYIIKTPLHREQWAQDEHHLNINCEVKHQALSPFRIFSSWPNISPNPLTFSRGPTFLLFGSQWVLPNKLLMVQRLKKTQRWVYLVSQAIRQSAGMGRWSENTGNKGWGLCCSPWHGEESLRSNGVSGLFFYGLLSQKKDSPYISGLLWVWILR